MSEDKKVSRDEEMKKLETQVKDIEALDKCESEIVDNAIEFEIKEGEGRNYRVRMPTIREKMEINQKRLVEARKLQKADFLYEAELINELLEKQGIDIEKLNSEIFSLNDEINKLELKLAPEPNKDNREKLKSLIIELTNERLFKIGRKSEYLETSIESQLTEIMITHFAALIFEKKTENKWNRVFNSYDEYIDSTDTFLVTTAVNYVYKLLF